MTKKTKVIRLFAGQSFEEDAVELLQKYEPGPVYILSTETPEGQGVYLCDEPFTLEEAEEQNLLMPFGPDEEPEIGDVGPEIEDE